MATKITLAPSNTMRLKARMDWGSEAGLRVLECSAWIFIGLAADMGDMVEGLGVV